MRPFGRPNRPHSDNKDMAKGGRGRTQVMTALKSNKTTNYWDGHPNGLAQWKEILQVAVDGGLARQVTPYTYELGPEFWEVAEEVIRPQGGGPAFGGRDDLGRYPP